MKPKRILIVGISGVRQLQTLSYLGIAGSAIEDVLEREGLQV